MARRACWLTAVVLAVVPSAAQGQGLRGYVGASVGTHAERSEWADGRSPAMGILGGVRFARDWSAEVELARPTRSFVEERTCQCYSFATTRQDFDRLAVTELLHEEREVLHSLTMGAVYHPRVPGRWTPRLFMGVTRHQVREIYSATVLTIPEGIDPARVNRRLSSARTRILGGPAFGAGVAFRISPRVSAGTDVRYDYGSMGDQINNVWRTSVRSVWSF
jgi:hypothetical protein